jgi:hypothetical protein
MHKRIERYHAIVIFARAVKKTKEFWSINELLEYWRHSNFPFPKIKRITTTKWSFVHCFSSAAKKVKLKRVFDKKVLIGYGG